MKTFSSLMEEMLPQYRTYVRRRKRAWQYVHGNDGGDFSESCKEEGKGKKEKVLIHPEKDEV